MPNQTHNAGQWYPDLQKKAEALLLKAGQEEKNAFADELYVLLTQAATLEHLLSMQYLYTAFSLKKYPEEFDDYPNPDPAINQKRMAQLEVIRRWEASILYVARQEMEHLNLVQNMIVILGKTPYLFRPNFPVPADQNVLGKPVNLMPFGKHAIEIFRYWEKPDGLHVPDPFGSEDVPKAIKKMGQAAGHPEQAQPFDQKEARKKAWLAIIDILDRKKVNLAQGTSIEELYEGIWLFFWFGFTYKLIEGTNLTKVSEEHFGFNITLDPIVDGKYFDYVDTVIKQILEEGEGVWGVPPPLDSHFTVFQKILDGINEEQQHSTPATFAPALPVVWNPTISQVAEHHAVDLPKGEFDEEEHVLTPITNLVTIQAMELFNTAYKVLIQMLTGYFEKYEKDYTTGIRPPEVNAYFRTSFYPFMTMVFRPLGEILCRMPADAGYTPVDGKVPPRTAGPNFFFTVPQDADIHDRIAATLPCDRPDDYINVFNDMADQAQKIGDACKAAGYHTANYKEPDARDFDTRFSYLSQNLHRIAQNFSEYWSGNWKAPIPSEGFQNFNNPYN